MFIRCALLHHTVALLGNFGSTVIALYNYPQNRRIFDSKLLIGPKMLQELGEFNRTLTTQEAFIVAMHDRHFIRYGGGSSAHTMTMNSTAKYKKNPRSVNTLNTKPSTTASKSISSMPNSNSRSLHLMSKQE